MPKSMGCSKISTKREGYNNRGLPQETGQISTKQSNTILKETRKRKTNKAQNQ